LPAAVFFGTLRVLRGEPSPSRAQKKAARRRVLPGGLGGGGNEACRERLAPHRFVPVRREARLVLCPPQPRRFDLNSSAPDRVPPADRLRAVLPVGTNRAQSLSGDRRSVRASRSPLAFARVFTHSSATLPLERRQCQRKNSPRNRSNRVFHRGNAECRTDASRRLEPCGARALGGPFAAH
jgi:hypothetical protein